MRAIICVGISGSGKSTWADHQYEYDDINRDNTRWMLSGKRGWSGPNAYKFHSDIEDAVTIYNQERLVYCAAHSLDVTISDTNLNPVFRAKMIKDLEKLGYEIEIKEFPISFQEALERDSKRGIYSVGQAVIEKQWWSWCRYWDSKNTDGNK